MLSMLAFWQEKEKAKKGFLWNIQFHMHFTKLLTIKKFN